MGSTPSRSSATVQPLPPSLHPSQSRYEISNEEEKKRLKLMEDEVTSLQAQLRSELESSNRLREESREQIESIRRDYDTKLAAAQEKLSQERISREEVKRLLDEETKKNQQLNHRLKECEREVSHMKSAANFTTTTTMMATNTNQTTITTPAVTVGQTIHKGEKDPYVSSNAYARPVWECSVSLSWLQTFARDIDPTLSTADVVQKIIIPNTLTTKRRYTDKLAAPEYSSPTFFVSHRWSDRFRELVETLTEHCQTSGQGDPTQVFLWIDIFAVNQHIGAAQAEDLSNLDKAIIESTKGTLLVMDPAGGVVKRIWCLFEIHKTVQLRVGKEGDLILLLSKHMDVNIMKDVWMTLDVEKAEATVPADRDKILSDIRSSDVDIHTLNKKLKGVLLKGAVLQANSARDTFIESLARAGELFRMAGFYEAARVMIEETIAMHLMLNDRESDQQQLKLAQYQYQASQLRPQDGSQLLEARESLAIRRRLHRSDHPDLAASIAWLGLTSANSYDFTGGETLIREGLSMYRRLSPTGESIDVANSLRDLAAVLNCQEKWEESLQNLQLAVEMMERVQGERTVLWAHIANNTTLVCLNLNQPEKALPLAEGAYQIFSSVYGDHPMTAQILGRLGLVLDQLGRKADARDTIIRCLNLSKTLPTSLGKNDPWLAEVEFNLARVMCDIHTTGEDGIHSARTHCANARSAFLALGNIQMISQCDKQDELLTEKMKRLERRAGLHVNKNVVVLSTPHITR